MGALGMSLDFKFLLAEMGSSIGGLISEFLRNHSPSEKIVQLAEYIDELEAEKKKIEPFKSELPLCMLLLEITIVAVKEVQREKSNAVPLEEFMPSKKIADEKREKIENSEDDVKSRDKMNWMSSVQLWNSYNQHLNDEQTLKPDNIKSCKNRIAGTALWPFKSCTNFPVLPVVEENGDESTLVPRLSLGTPEANNRPEEMNSSAFSSKSSCGRSGSNVYTDNHSRLSSGQQSQQMTRKQRRCWSPELHRRFVDALQKLGGAQAATPKQIRELMRVDGLSNDEVKSHLQKYRIHACRVGASTSANHPIVLGASWMLSRERCSEFSKQRKSRSGSPQRHTHLAGFSRATSLTGGESMEEEDDEIQLSLGDNDDVKMGRLRL
ncbi:transcription factor HHO2-like [Primulina huaijiensis]|uniref:transcription factor HHO2-like n=1 Tax=Primulina huaijiensis TaxID=1492673 RepID=UPI003CC7745A